MTVAFNFSLDCIKIRWEEPYVSEGLNRKLSMLPSGIYRGCQCGPTSPESKSFLFGPDVLGTGVFVDSMFVYTDLANGVGIAVHDPDLHTIDMSAEFSGPGGTIPSNQTWHVWADATYTLGAPSASAVNVTKTTPPVGAIRFCRIEMVLGDTVISAARFNYVGATWPRPTVMKDDTGYAYGDRVLGFITGGMAWQLPTNSQKDAMTNATAPSASNPFVTKGETLEKVMAQPIISTHTITPDNKFKISGKVYVGKGAAGSANNHFYLMLVGSLYSYPLLGTDGRQIGILSINKDVGGSPGPVVNPSVDADADGFIQNVWVYGDFSKTVDTQFPASLDVWYSIASKYSSLYVSTFPTLLRNPLGHANSILSGSEVGTPDSLPTNYLQETIRSVLGFINSRIKTIHPTASAPGWILLWRSGNVTSEIDVGKDTVSIYWMNGKLAIVVGGFLSGSLIYSSKDAGEHTILTLFHNNEDSASYIHAVKRFVAAGISWAWESSLNWDAWHTIPLDYGSVPDAFCKILQHGPLASGEWLWTLGMGNVREGFGWAICANCSWNESTNLWNCGTNADPSFALFLTDEGLTLAFKASGANATPWAQSGWESRWYLEDWAGARLNAFPRIDGSAWDRVRVSMGGTRFDNAYNVSAQDGATWHAQLEDITSGDVSLTTIDSLEWETAFMSITDVNQYGCRVYGYDSGGSTGVGPYWDGYVTASFDV